METNALRIDTFVKMNHTVRTESGISVCTNVFLDHCQLRHRGAADVSVRTAQVGNSGNFRRSARVNFGTSVNMTDPCSGPNNVDVLPYRLLALMAPMQKVERVSFVT